MSIRCVTACYRGYGKVFEAKFEIAQAQQLGKQIIDNQ
jgi:hypothetical protein